MKEKINYEIKQQQKKVKMKDTKTSAKKKYAQKYRSIWESDDRFSGWLQPVVGDVTKAWCRICGITLMAHISSLRGHAEVKKHKDKVNARSRRKEDSICDTLPPELQDSKTEIDARVKHPHLEPNMKITTFLQEYVPDMCLDILEPNKGAVIIEGKTKVVHEIEGDPNQVLVINKDRITAGDGVRAHDLEGKAAISNATNAKVFNFLQQAGIKTSWVNTCGDTSYVSRRCHMIPLEWVTRRVATGSFLKRHVGVTEGYRFTPPKMETFFKDDANHDPQWSEEQIIEAQLKVGGTVISRHEYDIMARTTVTVFEVLEKAWASLDCALIDMKIEFGIDNETKEILVSDTIDSDSWRLWPSGDKRLMKDKQVYRNLETVTEEGLNQVKRNFQWVAEKLDSFIPSPKCLVVVLMGSPSDAAHCEKIRDHCKKLGMPCELRVTSAHKGTQETLAIVARYEGMGIPVVFIAVAGRSNGLGPVVCANTSYPVINCPPLKPEEASRDVWSSLSLPSGMGCGTVLYPEAAAQSAAAILGLHDHVIWSKIRAKQLNLWISLKNADRKMCQTN